MDFQNKLDRLIAMQKLCAQVEEDNAKIDAFIDFLSNARQRHDELMDFYDEEWVDLQYDENGNPTEDADALSEALSPHITEEHYSIMSEDTIWDALGDHRFALLDLLKTLVTMID